LGAAVINRCSKIIYIQDDPNGGACRINPKKLGDFYQDQWPEIYHSPYSKEPKKHILQFLETRLDQSNDGLKLSWFEKMHQSLTTIDFDVNQNEMFLVSPKK